MREQPRRALGHLVVPALCQKCSKRDTPQWHISVPKGTHPPGNSDAYRIVIRGVKKVRPKGHIPWGAVLLLACLLSSLVDGDLGDVVLLDLLGHVDGQNAAVKLGRKTLGRRILEVHTT